MERLFSALPTPFFNGKIDYVSLEKLIEFQIENGVEGLVFSGSTGEGHSLSKEEWIELIKFGVKVVKNRCAVVAGIGFNITYNAVEYTKMLKDIGINYILATVPYYNKPQQDGIYKHFEEICNCAKETGIILYNVPSRTVTDMSNDTIVKLVNNFSNIVALKDATGKLERVAELKMKLKDIRDDFVLLSGNDITQIGFNAMGGKGVISVISNINPKLCKKVQEFTKNNDFNNALMLQDEIVKFSQSLFCETNPVPVKYALYKLGIFSSQECRLPLIELSKTSKKSIELLLNN